MRMRPKLRVWEEETPYVPPPIAAFKVYLSVDGSNEPCYLRSDDFYTYRLNTSTLIGGLGPPHITRNTGFNYSAILTEFE